MEKYFTELKDRILWFDGDVTFTIEQLYDYILRGGVINDTIHVNQLNSDIINFNNLNPSLKLGVKKTLKEFDKTWNIPTSYKSINIGKYVIDKLTKEIAKQGLSDSEVNKRIDRVELELKKYKEFNMNVILKTIIYVVDVFKANNVVWGTGRGSSCSSYILYLIGLHNVDAVKWDLDIKEFFN
jgi:DNA polymerase III alpha subunit